MPLCWPSGLSARLFKNRENDPTNPEKLPDSGSSTTSASGSTLGPEADTKPQKSKKTKWKGRRTKKKSDDNKTTEDNSDLKKDGEDAKVELEGNKEGEKRKVAVGSVCEAKNIYKGPADEEGNWTWSDKCPDDVEEAAENEETAKFAIIVRKQKSNDSRKSLEAHSIIIQSPWLRKALSDILNGYHGVVCELSRLEFEAPFKPFVHRWTEFTKYLEKPDLDEKTKEHMQLLYNILDYEIGDKVRAFQDYLRNGVVSFKDLWMIFQPGQIVVSKHIGKLSGFEMLETEYMSDQCGKFLQVRCDSVEYDGKEFGRYMESINIPEFLGTKKITGLKVYPLHFHEKQEELKAELIKRGEIFEKLAGHHYKQYTGKAITWDREGNEVEVQINGRIVVDIDSFNRFSPFRARYVNEWTPADLENFTKYKAEKGLPDDKFVLPPYYQMIARPRTSGYSLKYKKWVDFFVDQISEIEWNEHAFDRLVLPPDQKELILSFSESQLAGSKFDDVISGKGKGIICLLSGPPGVGKTLTAEAVAENLRVPLHMLTSGELGSDPWVVERELTSILELVARWNAILLLDECDVFLEARSTHELERNKIVSIFLRTLEYYEGIMFMTTNRVEDIDAAFQSRIHVSIEYPDLNSVSRRTIWSNFLKGSSLKSSLTDRDIAELAELKLNGRQIKNVLKTAQLLAARKKSPTLDREFIETVLKIEKKRPGVPQPDKMLHYM